MKRALLLVLLVALSSFAYANAEERLEVVSAFWGTPDQPVDVRPGDEKVPLTLVLQNKYSYMIIGIYAELTLPEGFHNITGGNVASAAFGPSLPPGGVATLTFLIDIDEDVEPGNYTFHLWTDYFDSVYSEMEDEFEFTLNVEPPISLELSSAGWGTPEQPMKPTPGMDGVPLYVWITNPSTSAVYGLNLTLDLPEGISAAGRSTAWASIPVVNAGQSAMATFMLDIDENAPVGPATFDLYLEYRDQWSAEFEVEDEFSLTVYPEPDVAIGVEDVSLEQGSSLRLNATVSNVGSSEIYDVLPSLQAQGLLILRSPSEPLDELRPGENFTFTFEVYAPSNLPPSSIPALLKVSYKSQEGLVMADSSLFKVDVLLSTRKVEISASTTEIKYQRLNEVVLTVKNWSERPLYDVEVSLTPPSNLPLYVEEGVGPWKLGRLMPGEAENITLHVLPFSQMEGATAITATVTYRDEGTTATETQALLFYLKGCIDITLVNWKLSPDPAYNGSKVSFTASLLNRGTQQAYYTRVYLKAKGPFQLGRTSDKYIGDLPTNSPTPFSLQFSISPDAKPGSYKVDVMVEYTDTLGQKHEISWPLQVDVVEGHSSNEVHASQQPLIDQDMMIIIGLAVLLIITIFWGYRRGKGREEVEEEIEAV